MPKPITRSKKCYNGSCHVALVIFKYIIIYPVHLNMFWHVLFFHLSLEGLEAAGMIHCMESSYLPSCHHLTQI